MHQNRSISLVSALFDHFHFHPLSGLPCYPQPISCAGAGGASGDAKTARDVNRRLMAALQLGWCWANQGCFHTRRSGNGCLTVIPTERKDADKGCTFTNAFKPVNIKALKQIKTAIENIHGATLVLSHQENG